MRVLITKRSFFCTHEEVVLSLFLSAGLGGGGTFLLVGFEPASSPSEEQGCFSWINETYLFFWSQNPPLWRAQLVLPGGKKVASVLALSSKKWLCFDRSGFFLLWRTQGRLCVNTESYPRMRHNTHDRRIQGTLLISIFTKGLPGNIASS